MLPALPICSLRSNLNNVMFMNHLGLIDPSIFENTMCFLLLLLLFICVFWVQGIEPTLYH